MILLTMSYIVILVQMGLGDPPNAADEAAGGGGDEDFDAKKNKREFTGPGGYANMRNPNQAVPDRQSNPAIRPQENGGDDSSGLGGSISADSDV